MTNIILILIFLAIGTCSVELAKIGASLKVIADDVALRQSKDKP